MDSHIVELNHFALNRILHISHIIEVIKPCLPVLYPTVVIFPVLFYIYFI